MMLIEQSVAPLQFVRLEQSHLQAVQDDLILGAGHPKFFAHAPKLEKSEGACPAKRVYAFPLNYLHSVMDWRWSRCLPLATMRSRKVMFSGRRFPALFLSRILVKPMTEL